ncbi:VOC family protein [Chitinophaga solisilvae]|uniref:VOC family protein n=1 Tax=Chitinophaga solisilvae TaxID=1233460 RepID=UPI001367A1EE|nr:VOC family protein [Chitinophaga solisilvae]
MEIPKGHQAVMPYMMLSDAAGFIRFTEKVFGAMLTHTTNRDNTDKIMHAEIQIAGNTIMFCDATEQWKEQTANLFVYVPDADTTYHTAIDNGGATIMELTDQHYGRTCGVKDPVGNVWWITSVK